MFGRRFDRRITFIIASATMMILCLSNSSPIPFYTFYQQSFSISSSILSISTVLYFLGNVTGLLFFSRISNYIGRKYATMILLSLAILGCISFYIVDSGLMLLLGRSLQGLSCGMSAGALQAYILDTGSTKSNIGIIISTNIPLIGFSLGSIFSGSIVEEFPSMIHDYFLLLIILFLICIIFILFSTETIKRKKGVLSSLKPVLKFPSNVRQFLPLAMILLITLYSITGFYQTFSSTMGLEQFGFSSKIIAALIYSSIIFPQIFGSLFIKRFGIKKAQSYGFIGFTISMLLIIFTLFNSYFLYFLVANILASLCCGLAFTACIESLISRVSKEDRAGVLSIIYIITDGGTAVFNLIVSILLSFFTFQEILFDYTLWVVIALFLVLYLIKRTSFEYDY